MPNVPAFCSQCGLVFASGFAIENSTNIQLQDVTSACPRCGGNARVPDGVYNVLGGIVELLTGPTSSVEQLCKLQATLERVKAEGKSREEVQAAINEAAPELTSLASALPSTRGELYAFLTVILMLLGLIVPAYAAWKPPGLSQAEIDAMVAKALEQSTKSDTVKKSESSKKRTSPKVGRNDLCPCGSGKKYKRCCLLTEG